MTQGNDHSTDDPVLLARRKHVLRHMRFLTVMAAIGGFLFGYDTGVISGAMLPMTRAFDLSREQQQVVVSSTILSAAVSSLFGGSMNDKFGRRPSILFAAAIFSVGSLLLLFSSHYSHLVLGRIVVGVGVGVASLTTPIYIAEVALPEMRGQLVTINTLLITLGQFSAGMADGILDELFPTSGWRGMLGLAAVPSTIMFFGFLRLPESPRWLAGNGKIDQAKQVLYSLRETDEQANEELMDIIKSLPKFSGYSNSPSESSSSPNNTNSYGSNDSDQQEDVPEDEESTTESALHRRHVPSSSPNNTRSYGSNDSEQQEDVPEDEKLSNESVLHRAHEMLSHAPTRRALFLGCGLMIFQQFAGVSTIMYYAATIYQMSGFDELTSVWLSGFTALAQVAGIIASTIFVDRAGRRTLVLASLSLVSISLMGMAISFYLSRVSSGIIIVDLEHTPDDLCSAQAATVWDGITAYCYDCTSIPGCGYCNGTCVEGNANGPFSFDNSTEYDVCLPAHHMKERIAGVHTWRYKMCPNSYGFMSVFFMVMYLLTFGIGMSAMPWTINSEIYPLKFRSMAVSISTATNWMGNWIVSATFLSISSPHALTAYGAFVMYASIAVFGTIWLYFALPETKGLSLEEVERLFRRPTDGNDGVQHNHRALELL